MLETDSPIGTKMAIPETLHEDAAYFSADGAPEELLRARTYYDAHGYVVLRGLIPAELCARVRAAFADTVRRSRVPVLRQKNMRYERHNFDADGFLSNPIFNVQDLGSRELNDFRTTVLDILTCRATAAATAALLRCERTKIIQSMFFEAPAGTWAHQDSYYQDSATGLGGCVAGWFALEDIAAGAGRFYVCPGSHRGVSPVRNHGENNFATGHEKYQQSMLEMMRENALGFAAPYLAAGDVLFWNSLTVHGSLPASRPGLSRTSLTAHFLREDDEMLQFHSRIRKLETRQHNGMTVCLLHDQDKLHNRLVREAAFHFPATYMAVRRMALWALLTTRAMRGSATQSPPAALVPELSPPVTAH